MNKDNLQKFKKAKNLFEELAEDLQEKREEPLRSRYLQAFDEAVERFDVELQEDEEGDELDEVYSEWDNEVNMNASQLRKWSRNPCSRQASVDPVAVMKRNLRLLEKDKSEWTSNDVEDAKRTISFISRMKANRPDSPREGPHGCPSEWAISLLNWAYNPFDSVPTPSSEVKDDLDAVSEVSLSEELQSSYEFSPVPDQVLYSDRADAMTRARNLGLSGVHEHEFGPDNVTMYMPGSTHRDWVERVKSVPDREMQDFRFDDGEKVSWDSSGGKAMGVVRDRTSDSCYDAAIDGDVKVCGEPGNPAYLIEVFDDELTGTMVGHKEDALESASFSMREAESVVHADQEKHKENLSGEDSESVSVPPVAIQRVSDDAEKQSVEEALDSLWSENQ